MKQGLVVKLILTITILSYAFIPMSGSMLGLPRILGVMGSIVGMFVEFAPRHIVYGVLPLMALVLLLIAYVSKKAGQIYLISVLLLYPGIILSMDDNAKPLYVFPFFISTIMGSVYFIRELYFKRSYE